MKSFQQGVVIPIVLAFIGLVAVLSGVVYYGNKSITEYELKEVGEAEVEATGSAAETPWYIPKTPPPGEMFPTDQSLSTTTP